jgi:hypothetical protein
VPPSEKSFDFSGRKQGQARLQARGRATRVVSLGYLTAEARRAQSK